MNKNIKQRNGYFGQFGGQFVPETIMPALQALEKSYELFKKNKQLQRDFKDLLRDYVGRPTPLYFAENLSKRTRTKIYLKREDLAHTGAHKINNALGQGLLAKFMGKKRIIAETGAGQHGVATATVAARLGLECAIYMGRTDMERQTPNVYRMKLLGAKVIPVDTGTRTLKEAINEALRDWITNINSTYYLLGSALGPHPYPTIVRDFQAVIGHESRRQILQQENRLPDYLIACVGGGSNAIGLFHEFLNDRKVKMIGVEAGGKGVRIGKHASRFAGGQIGILHGTKSYVLQDKNGQIAGTYSISAGLDYAGIGPEHSFLRSIRRAKYVFVNDREALLACTTLAQIEGIIPALESSHAVAAALRLASKIKRDSVVIVNLSGRGDKDLDTLMSNLKFQ
jgi:tryptophan synthase beta chain